MTQDRRTECYNERGVNKSNKTHGEAKEPAERKTFNESVKKKKVNKKGQANLVPEVS